MACRKPSISGRLVTILNEDATIKELYPPPYLEGWNCVLYKGNVHRDFNFISFCHATFPIGNITSVTYSCKYLRNHWISKYRKSETIMSVKSNPTRYAIGVYRLQYTSDDMWIRIIPEAGDLL